MRAEYLGEKKPEYAVAAKDLLDDIHSYLNIQSVTGVRVLIRYDIENITDKTYESAKAIVFRSRRWMYCMKKSFRRKQMRPCSL